jgi:hypothetical protein
MCLFRGVGLIGSELCHGIIANQDAGAKNESKVTECKTTALTPCLFIWFLG